MSFTRPLRSAVLTLAVAAVTLVAAGCAAASSQDVTVTPVSPKSSSDYRGDQLSTPVALSSADLSATFQDSTGGTTSLAQLQATGLMLVYFGYTNCPDVCPTTMSDLGQALNNLPEKVQNETQVVFVTSDPADDTPPVMQAWLAHFDSGLARPFIGLTSTLTQIDTVAKSLGIPLSPPVTEPNGSISVEHGAQTLAFEGNKATVMWLADTSVADYSHDISKLATKLGK